MHNLIKKWSLLERCRAAMLALATLLASNQLIAEATKEPQFSITYNALETVGFIVANKLILDADNLTYLPFHFDANFRLYDWLGLSAGLVYRYEDYNEEGPLYSVGGNLRPTAIWTKFNEIFLLAGPRFSPLGTGLLGFYASVRGGIGTAISPRYFNVSALLQPEVGYSFSFGGNPGFYLTLGAGVLLNLPFYETKDFAVPWSRGYKKLNPIGIIVHHVTPILNVGLGFNG